MIHHTCRVNSDPKSNILTPINVNQHFEHFSVISRKNIVVHFHVPIVNVYFLVYHILCDLMKFSAPYGRVLSFLFIIKLSYYLYNLIKQNKDSKQEAR